MQPQWIEVQAIVKRGHGVASGIGKDSPYPSSTIEMQIPFFQALGLDLSNCFWGTLNVSIHPQEFKVQHPEFTFKNVKWSANHDPESFSFSRCQIEFNTITYNGYVYYPHPETKLGHFQDASTLEIIAPPIPQIRYGDRVTIKLNQREILLVE